MKKSTGKMALLLGVASAMGMSSGLDNGMPLVANTGRGKIDRQKSQLTPKQKKARAKNNAGKKARKLHRSAN